MDEKKIYEILNDIFRDVFDDDELTVTKDTTQDDIEEWDSLANINLVVCIEDEFDVKFDIKEITEMKSVGLIADAIKAKLA